jgi:alkanesulfonate monooxygenase SsuD/methylene tetrahydromethanopterin reductase-like flavin-dependent oxidoreductase (luciferase family)
MTDVGVLVHGFPEGHSLPSIAREIEGAGFDSVWSGDHILSTVDGLVACAALGAATERIRVGTAVYLPHLRPVPAVARMLATLNAAGLGERFTFGVGVGGDVPAEFELLDVNVRRRGALLDATLEGLRHHFEADDDFVDHGTFPPVWTGGRSVPALRRGLREGCGFAPYLVTVEQFSALRSEIPAAAEQEGFELAVNLLVAVDSPSERGVVAAQRRRPYGLAPDLVAKHVISGSPAECVARIQEYVAAGARHVLLNLAVEADAKHRQLELIAQEMLPTLQGDSHAK